MHVPCKVNQRPTDCLLSNDEFQRLPLYVQEQFIEMQEVIDRVRALAKEYADEVRQVRGS